MTERIYDALKAVLYIEFPKNNQGMPVIYDRVVKNWFTGDRQVVPDDVSIIFKASSVSESDDFYGYRKLEYNFSILLQSAGSDQITTLRLATEGARIIRNVLTNHKRIWVMDLCPICGKLPTSPEHYFSDSTHNIIFGTYGLGSGPAGIANDVYNDFITTWLRTHPSGNTPGTVTAIQILTSGSNYVSAPVVTIGTGGNGSSGAVASASITSGSVDSITMIEYGTQYTYAPSVTFIGGGGNSATARAIISAPSPAGIAAAAFNRVYKNYANGIIPTSLSVIQKNRFNDLLRDQVLPIREIFDVQINSVTPTNEAIGDAFISTSTIDIKCKELLPITRFGPSISGSTYSPLEAL